MNGIKFLENKIMNLERAFDIVINEAEISAIGERNDEHLKVLLATEVMQAFYEEHGHRFADFSLDNED
ncbi:MAG: hypothetical protein EBY39_08280 [Flavobacteriia bacterium]|jgi:hypothetical protein|nr:hypothetical protein [Flavobacteriia bacterium]